MERILFNERIKCNKRRSDIKCELNMKIASALLLYGAFVWQQKRLLLGINNSLFMYIDSTLKNCRRTKCVYVVIKHLLGVFSKVSFKNCKRISPT